ncbi:hypothetical protein HBH98_185940 [Parastagonospora nodorum]|nr:hypothetical protein HBH53_185480 [Parastagonospora nodorum]KAH3964087.1 hypothetical protein HBH51_160320 [Parastagonospora nodorum]KAH4176597.1 hypothetical protein HBH43_061000 [Parastagonospora nodorum]KAH4340999.1 hypothetical protein HBH98_185940 [Parastagonospora nodorum]KAH4393573.1 hypothetical protein HBH97_030470 [Parastagonospora nodorum]
MPPLTSSFPFFKLSNLDTEDTSSVRPSDSTEAEEKMWTDTELMDDARPGRRGNTDDQRWKYSAPTKAKEKDVDEGEYLPHPLDEAEDNEDGRLHVVKSWYHVPADGVKAVGWFKSRDSASKGAEKDVTEMKSHNATYFTFATHNLHARHTSVPYYIHNHNSHATMQSKIFHMAPPLTSQCPEELDTSRVEPSPSEGSQSDWVEVADREWSDEALLDDARPGWQKWAKSDGAIIEQEKKRKKPHLATSDVASRDSRPASKSIDMV